MKKGPAILFSFLITIVVAVVMMAIGINALLNPNQTAIANPSSAIVNTADALTPVQANPSASTSSDQVKQLQNTLAQYQARDTQYQQQLSQAKQEITQANQQLQAANSQIEQLTSQLQQAQTDNAQYQQLLTALQQAGIISIDRNGNVRIPFGNNNNSGGSGFGDDNGGNN